MGIQRLAGEVIVDWEYYVCGKLSKVTYELSEAVTE